MFTKLNKSTLKSFALLSVIIVFLIFLSGCACQVDMSECMPEEIYGFWGGLWHGIISPITFIISLFKDDVAMYACNNTGGWYDFGFVIGAGILFGGGSKASSKRK